MNKETEAATASLAKHLDIALPLPFIANEAVKWHLKKGEDAKLKLIEQLENCLFDNRHGSLRSALEKALAGFNVTEKG